MFHAVRKRSAPVRTFSFRRKDGRSRGPAADGSPCHSSAEARSWTADVACLARELDSVFGPEDSGTAARTSDDSRMNCPTRPIMLVRRWSGIEGRGTKFCISFTCIRDSSANVTSYRAARQSLVREFGPEAVQRANGRPSNSQRVAAVVGPSSLPLHVCFRGGSIPGVFVRRVIRY